MNTKPINLILVYSDLFCEWARGSRETLFQSWVEESYGIKRSQLSPLSFLYNVVDPLKYTLFLLKYSNEIFDTQ